MPPPPPTTLTLAIEMSNPSCESGVAIGSASGTLGTEPIHAGDGRHDDLITAIDRLTRRLGLTPRDLARVAVSTGPGGYTALRIAIATTKLLCESLDAVCIPVPTPLIVARRAPSDLATPFAVILASKDNTAFATIFDALSSPRDPGRLIDTSDDLNIAAIIADRFLPKAIAESAAARGITIHPPRFDPAACLELSFNHPAVDPLALAPLYPREPEAVTKWRQRKGQ